MYVCICMYVYVNTLHLRSKGNAKNVILYWLWNVIEIYVLISVHCLINSSVNEIYALISVRISR